MEEVFNDSYTAYYFIVGIYSCMLRFDSNRTDAGGQAGRTYRSDQRRAETYWGKNKGRSMEGGLELATRILAVVFVVLSLILNLKIFQ